MKQPYNQLTSSVTLNNCDQEPVHVPGCLMPHGTLLAVDAADGRIQQAARNAEQMLGKSLSELLGSRLDDLQPGLLAEILARVAQTTAPVSVEAGDRNGLQLIAHRNGDVLVLEWEPAGDNSPSLLLGTQAALARLEACADLSSLLQLLTEEIRSLFGIDRVMVYRFHPDWTGEVLAEAAHPKLETSYMGLHFPATDIPAPARAIYEKVWLRVIQDAQAEPVAVEPLVHPGSKQPLDLTYSVLRAVSPMHVEYLKNMGVQGTVSCSLRVDGKLWGLVACHHYAPLLLRQQQRASLELFGRVISQRIYQLQEAATLDERESLARALENLTERLEREDQAGLFAALPMLPTVLESTGVVVSHQKGWYSIGDVPYESELEAIRSHLVAAGQRVYQTDRLPDLCPLEHPKRHCGLLALAPNGPEGEMALWFRPEEASTVRWAGHPDSKEIRYGPNGPRLHPRASFAEYIERASGRSRPWTDFDLWKIERLLRVLDASAARHTRRMQASNFALQRSNEELDSFAFMASHDLREPLRGIHHYAQFLEEDYGEVLPGEGKQMLSGVVSLTVRMESLISSLLTYSRLNHQHLACCPCDLQKMAEESATILFRARKIPGRIEVQPGLPMVYAHPPFLEQILANLISNAIKYSEADRVIEIGSQPQAVQDGRVTFFVRDNGLGIPAEFHERVFQLFRRLHLPDERGGGAGAGLTIVRRMVERHGGTIELESAPGQGSTFYVTLSGQPSAPEAAGDPPPEPV
ncbi:MAG: GAF domain-containing protein [Candidatus Eremiobacteraeota bacterium]|nr:GAF domain-containing protein [Candidatus Eremiobacteraeota bacterium]